MIAGCRHSSEDLALHRAAAGMPAEGVLLCNFNQVFKLDPVMFDLWLNITASAPGSSLVRAPTLNLNNAFAY